MSRTPALVISLALAAGGLGAAAASAATPTWAVDKANSRLGFDSSFGGTAFSGAFKRWDAKIAFDPAALPASSVTATIDLASAGTGDASRDEAIVTPDWFSTAKFPTATFKSAKITAAGPGRYVAAGTLTIRGVTKPVQLPFQLAIAGKQAKMNGSLVLNRSEFGVGQGQFAGGETVPLNVTVKVAITAQMSSTTGGK